jgi:DnaJ-class molecular chaperone
MKLSEAFNLLGITAMANRAAAKQAYLSRAKVAHPDHGGQLREFQRLRQAWGLVDAYLKQPQKCEACGGVGTITQFGPGFFAPQRVPCKNCDGNGSR